MEEQMILRLPECISEDMRARIRAQMIEPDTVLVRPKPDGGERDFEFEFEGTVYPAKLVDMPCIIECHKTFDKSAYYKSGDICQMLIVGESQEVIDAEPVLQDSGLTPPTTNIRSQRFRKQKYTKEEIAKAEAQLCSIMDGAPIVQYELVTKEIEVDDSQDEDEEGEEDESEAYDDETPVPDQTPTTGSQNLYPIRPINALRRGSTGMDSSLRFTPDTTPMTGVASPYMQGVSPSPSPYISAPKSPTPIEPTEDTAMDVDEETPVDSSSKKWSIEQQLSVLEEDLVTQQDKLAAMKNPVMKRRIAENVKKLETEKAVLLEQLKEFE